MRVIVLCSGGMDSVTALYWAVQEHQVIAAVSFEYGSKHNSRELPRARAHADELGITHEVIPLGFIGRLFASDLLESGGKIPEGHYEDITMRRTVVPFRNGIMLAVACGLAESRKAEGVVIAAHAGDHVVYPDCREPFLEAMGTAMRKGTYAGIRLLRPFVDLNKSEIVVEGVQLGVDYSRTWSCYKGGEVHCGKCGTCVERREAFVRANVPDPTTYADTGP